MPKTLKIEPGEPIRCVIMAGEETSDSTLFNSAVRIGVGRLIVIGPVPDKIKTTAKATGMEVEFFPTGTPIPNGTNVALFQKR